MNTTDTKAQRRTRIAKKQTRGKSAKTRSYWYVDASTKGQIVQISKDDYHRGVKFHRSLAKLYGMEYEV